MHKIVKFITNHPIFTSVFLLMMTLSLFFGLEFFSPKTIKADQKSLPIYGWYICGELGIGNIPNHAPAQRFRLCNRDGTQLLAFCLDQNKPPPPVGTFCDRMTADMFWCGDVYQPLRIYELIPTRTPLPTATFTRTPTPSSTPTATRTPTHTATITPTHTATATQTLTLTPREVSTSTLTQTPTSTTTTSPTPTDGLTQTPTREIESTVTVTPTLTPTKRARMGGESNFQLKDMAKVLAGFGSIFVGALLALANWKKIQRN